MRPVHCEVDAQGGKYATQVVGARMFGPQLDQDDPGRRSLTRVRGAAPVDQERNWYPRWVGRLARELPFQQHSVRPLAVHGLDWTGVIPSIAGTPSGVLDVGHTGCPPDQAGETEAIERERNLTRRSWLVWIDCDDLQVTVATEGEQRIVGSAANVLATGRRPDAEPFGQLLDSSLKVVDSVDDVVNHLHGGKVAQVA